jgi:hypothetical protein
MKSLFAYSLKFAIYSFIFACLIFLAAPVAQAQSLSLSIWPPLLEVMIRPGKSITQVYKLSNEGETDLLMTSSIVPFEPVDELGNIVIRETQAPDWFSFQNADIKVGQNFLLKQGQTQQVVLAIKTPTTAEEDDYYLTLLFETQSLALNEGLLGAQAQAKIGTNILLTVSETGEPPRKAEIAEFKIKNAWFKLGSWQFIDSFVNPLFILRIKNIGRSLFKPMGTLTVSGWTGGKYLLDLLPENILTNSVRQAQCFSADKNQPSPCQPETNWKNKFLIGVYQAQVGFGLDKISQDYQQTIHFFAFPFSLIAGLLLLILLLTILLKNYQIKRKDDS